MSEAFYRAIGAHPRVAVERIPNGTNLTRLTLKGVDPAQVVRRLAERGVRMPAPAANGSRDARASTKRGLADRRPSSWLPSNTRSDDRWHLLIW